MRPKFALTAMVALASTVAHAGDTCRVNDPTGTPLNLRASPNGHIVRTLSNGDHVTLLDRASDRGAKTWVHVGNYEDSKPIGWVFREFLACGIDPVRAIKCLKPDGTEEPCVRAKPEPPPLMDELHQLIQALSADRTRPSWPSPVDVTKSAESDNTYGNPVAPYIRPGGASIPIATPKEVSRWVNTVPEATGRSEKTTSDTARRFHEQWLAAERSPMAKLGFKPGSHIQTPASTGVVNMSSLGPIGGLYNPNNDRSWSHEKYPDYAVHESIHRALYDLRRVKKLPPGLPRDEDIVRALMNKNYKLPNARLPRGADVPREQLDYLEALAAQRVAEKHPGGPR